MADSVLKIFSYLPNPRVWKAQIAAEIIGVQIEVVGDKPAALPGWLWDFQPRLMSESERRKDSPYARKSRRGFSGTLYKSDEFLAAHPFGTVPAAFSPDGQVGVFESNSILRAVARSHTGHELYGRDGYEASRIDSFLDAGLVFAREAQVYLLGIASISEAGHERMSSAYDFYLDGIERALAQGAYLCGDSLTIADISFACDLAQFLRERELKSLLDQRGLHVISEDIAQAYPLVHGHLLTLMDSREFALYMVPARD